MSWDEIHHAIASLSTEALGEVDRGREITLRSCRDKSHHSPEPVWAPDKGASIIPTIRVGHCTWPKSLQIRISWTSPVFDLNPSIHIRRTDIKEFLASQQEQEHPLFGHALCPHVAIDDGQLLLPFEPNQCVCFQHDAHPGPEEPSSPKTDPVMRKKDSQPPSKSLVHSCKQPGSRKCCRCLAVETTQKIPRQGHFMRPEHYEIPRSEGWTMKRENQCDLYPWSAFHILDCSRCGAKYTWFRSGRDNRRVFLKFERRVSIPEAVTSKEWLASMDPESWGLSEDADLKHVVWCDEGGCEMRYRWKALYRALAPHTDEVIKTLRDEHMWRRLHAYRSFREAD